MFLIGSVPPASDQGAITSRRGMRRSTSYRASARYRGLSSAARGEASTKVDHQ